jgi:hypothetical protein
VLSGEIKTKLPNIEAGKGFNYLIREDSAAVDDVKTMLAVSYVGGSDEGRHRS